VEEFPRRYKHGTGFAATGHKASITGVQYYADIGGFGEISGCLQKMNSAHQLIGRPTEEDLGSWGHHCDPSTVPDTILQCSAGEEDCKSHVMRIAGGALCHDRAPGPNLISPAAGR
ncbi:hypothetical protein ACJX0J_037005, partial [Zea mays]